MLQFNSLDSYFETNFTDLNFVIENQGLYKDGILCNKLTSEFDSLPWTGVFDSWLFLPKISAEEIDGFDNLQGKVDKIIYTKV